MTERSSNKVDIIITGLMRNTELIKHSINDFIKLCRKGLVNQIIFSTWDYELEKSPDIVGFLKKNKVLIIGNKEPIERGYGNINCQMKALEEGLRRVDSQRFILKTRADIYINPIFLEYLFKNKNKILKIKINLPNGNIFKYKFWTLYFEITKPFYLSDETYFGHYQDHQKLINYRPYRNTYNLQSGTIHMQRWIEPFLNKYPIFRDFLENHPSVGYPNEYSLFYKGIKKIAKKNKLTFKFLNSITLRNRFKFLKKRLKEQRYINVLAAYYSILYSHFYINTECANLEINKKGIWRRGDPFNKNVKNPDLLKNFSIENATGKRQGQIYAHNDDFLKNIFEGKIESDDNFSNRLLTAIAKFNENNKNLTKKLFLNRTKNS